MTDTGHITALNRAAWDASAPLHGTGPAWDALCRGFRDRTFSVFDETMTAALNAAGVQGARVVQIGCNNGRETLSALALGASEALGIDQSNAFLDQARTLADLSPHSADFLCADIYALPADTPRDFDIAFITIGVINWMPDLGAFFAAVAGLLRPGGQLVIYETHPMLEMFDPNSATPDLPAFSYFQSTPHIETGVITYDGTRADADTQGHWYIHTLGAIVQAGIDAGLRLTTLREFAQSNREVDYDIYENRSAQIPMSYLMRVVRT
ncbi:class I SAM-dependent methyltransferase [uncultured Sulfitobacter sp.]|uniref:class I SAM-dependent methyltransferase n=1 Tax=uncultured Sulfitobacter sp. TaxID=191468 RepID=UPI00261509AB|nr:class I SAM-dependent methyltransferase [uncultured Sulfitobacter sp.]